MSATMECDPRHCTFGNFDFAWTLAENERLKEQLSHAVPAIEELTKEREMYRMRWLGSLTPEEAALIRDENVRLRIAGRRLESAAQDVYLPEEPDAATWQELRDAAQAMRIACGDEQAQRSK